MTSHHTRTTPRTSAARTTRRRGTALAAGLAAAVLLPLGLAAPAVAATGIGTGSQSTAVSPERAQSRTASDPAERIEYFYDSYISALGEHDQPQAIELREANLTAAFQEELAEWEEANGADGITRSQDVPVNAEAEYDGSGMGHTWAIVTLHWDGSPETTKVHVQAELATGKIDGIKLWEN